MVVSLQIRAILVVFLVKLHGILGEVENDLELRTIRYKYDTEYEITIKSSIEYVFKPENITLRPNSLYPAKVSITCYDANGNYPIFITARQQKGILSWQLPLVVDNVELYSISRTLCPSKNFDDVEMYQKDPLVNIYTSSKKNLKVTLKIQLVQDFYLKINQKKALTVSPSQPAVFSYSFNDGEYSSDAEKSEKSQKTVNVIVNSEDEHCMLMSIQNVSCPIFDTENDILYEGDYETISTKGAISVMEKHFPFGFHVVLLVKTTNKDCVGYAANTTLTPFSQFFDADLQPFDRPTKTIRTENLLVKHKKLVLEVTPSIGQRDYWIATTVALAIIVFVYIVFLIAVFFIKYRPLEIDETDAPDVIDSLHMNESCEVRRNSVPMASINTDPENAQSNSAANSDSESIRPRTSVQSNFVVVTKSSTNEIYLDQLCTRNTKIIKQQSSLYLWHVVTIAIFYALPVVQLVITYQRILNRSGNHDLCYYNFLCSHPLGYLSDFNHIYSNIGYVLLGALFMFFVRRRERRHHDAKFEMYYGIPQHYGLFYAMGVSLIMEGVLSASYHVCPNHSNFQFDTSFMYIMAVLSMVTIYQTRHPDINARAHATFSVLALAILICMFGVLYPNFYFWLFFTILHVSTCFILTMRIYYLGHWHFRNLIPSNCKELWHPTYRSRFILVLIGNLCNLSLAGFGLYNHSKDFASHLLYVFLMNLALHLAFYVVMKLTKSERPAIYTWLLMVAALATWAGSLYFFFSMSTSWALTPAQSRSYNRPCSLFKFYDTHDIWHFLSAFALFFSFMLLLTLDDDITHKLRNNIPVF